ncbi:MAG: sugar ABC transporter permease, partial [Mogibacterium sp.]|nr:sugar ABC transporter permease [Mogibacterium sp.]
MKKKKVKKSRYLYIVPGLFMVMAFVYVPIITNIVYSFFRLSSYSSSMKFVAFDNYRRLFTNDTFPVMMRNNIYYCIISLIVQVGFGTVIALVLESKLVGKLNSFYRNVYFIPSLISLTAVGLMFNFIYNPTAG